MNIRRLEGKVAVITGAGGGLGAECARVLALHGAAIAVADIDMAGAESVAAAIVEQGGQALALCADVSSEEAVAAMVAATVERFGRIDVLYNNAAILNSAQRAADRDICNMDVNAWDRAMAVNLRGAMLCSKHVIPVMLRQGNGSVLFATSGFGAQGDLTLSAYAASKAGVAMLSKSIAAQYGKQGIRSNAIQIGLVENAGHPLPPEIKTILLDNHLTPALGTPRQLADIVVFFASDESSFITGHTLAADGGFSSHTPSMAAMRGFFEKVGSNTL
ncbi:SDR family NAD(P)-dependent oxidoreductase [Glaciimonas immobilis]|uniref:NAD(P)-dependent dehydrogenase (Short-subunit alcohol dehydrogenase family) n=1 Tax=Glaciimonas immobilis TaxID=728004 RepID=A0A840RX63_9BURK|nr:SDR family oxidoreductase [Glaciimonas immobilis]KAF3996166.1 SDR family oxidoreductase [Glaciimonas immobilis]MBB5201678.1 NAD(P)-dependent dehydrogenase (short-subunit alcohol dehydrogenase family) [Glaciimonas immobilis]